MRIGNTLYFDYQATTPVDSGVFRVMGPYFGERFGNPHSVDHIAGWHAAQAVEKAAWQVAQLIGADADEIIFTSGATEANNLALLGLGRRAVAGKRRRILVSAIEHKSVLAVSRVLEDQLGYIVEQVPVDKRGHVDERALEGRLDSDVLVVSIMAVNNEIGTIQDITSISDLTRTYGALFHCDGAQAPCAMNLGEIGKSVDLFSLSGHKMYGPKGIGTLFVRRELQSRLEPIIYGGGQQNNLRSGTIPTSLCVGMGAAATTFIGEKGGDEREKFRNQRDRFVRKIEALGWTVRLNGPEGGKRHPGNANICFEGFSAHDILAALQPGLSASTGSACTSGIPETSHVLRAIGLSKADAEASIRFSIGRGTTNTDVDEAVSLMENVLSRLANAHITQTG